MQPSTPNSEHICLVLFTATSVLDWNFPIESLLGEEAKIVKLGESLLWSTHKYKQIETQLIEKILITQKYGFSG